MSEKGQTTILSGVIVLVICLTVFPLFTPGALYVGDYAASPINTAQSYISNAPQPLVLNVRNGGYDFVPNVFRWPGVPFYALSDAFVVLTGEATYAKLALVLYLVLGGLGMNLLIGRVRREQGFLGNGAMPMITRVGFSLLYVLNPMTLQVILKGYVGVLPLLALFPWLVLAYDWYARAYTRRSIVLRSLAISLIAFVSLTYTYPLLLIGVVLVAFEAVLVVGDPTVKMVGRALLRLALVFGFVVALEVPTILALNAFPTSQYVNSSTTQYLSVNQGVTILSTLSLTSGSFGPDYYVASFGVVSTAFAALMLCLLVIDVILFLLGRRTKWTLLGFIMLVAGLALAAGPAFPPNTSLYDSIPLFPETLELLPLVAFALFFLSGIVFVTPVPISSVIKRVESKVPHGRTVAILGVTLLTFALLFASCVPVGVAFSTNLRPTEVPSYDSQAYNWLESQPGQGRILLVPPSYANGYTFDSNTYAGPTDYWTLTPPHPVVIVDGGSMGGLEVQDATALYSGNTSLLNRLLLSQGIQFLVFRGDVVKTWDVPDYRTITPAYLLAAFPFLAEVATFGPITIFEDTRYVTQFQGFSHPLIVDGNTSSLATLAQLTPAYAPIVFSSDVSYVQLNSLLSEFSSPVIETGNSTPAFCGDVHCNVLWLRDALNATANVLNLSGHSALTVVGTPNGSASTTALGQPSSTFLENFSSPNATGTDWTTSGDSWALKNGSFQSSTGIYQPYALPSAIDSSDFLRVSSTFEIVSGFSAGILFTFNNQSITNHSFQIWLVPSWNSVLISAYDNGTGQSLQLVHFNLAYNQSYELTVTRIGPVLSVLVDGTLVSQSYINFTRPLFGALAATTALAKVFSFSETTFDGSTLTPSSYLKDEGGFSWTAFTDPSAGTVAITSSGDTLLGFYLEDASANVSALVSPQPLPLNVTSTGSLSWSFTGPSGVRVFVASDILSGSGWVGGSGAQILTVNGYAVGIVMEGSSSLTYASDYSLGVYASSAFASLALILVILEFLLSANNWRGKTPRLANREART